MPKRIQRQRTAGSRLPKDAVVVSRPTRWGNPFRVGMAGTPTPGVAVTQFIRMLQQHRGGLPRRSAYPIDDIIRIDLAGFDLACWCAPDVPCHADVLLDIASSPSYVDPDDPELTVDQRLALTAWSSSGKPMAVSLNGGKAAYGELTIERAHSDLLTWSVEVEADGHELIGLGPVDVRMGARSDILLVEGMAYAVEVECSGPKAKSTSWKTMLKGSGGLVGQTGLVHGGAI